MFAQINEDNANEAVGSFYDLHPYLSPAEDLDEYRRKWQDEDRRIADFHLHWPRRPYREDLRVLVAGCGTAQAATHALRRPSAHVIGIDISETSIHHTLELKQKYNLTNLDVFKLPIEQVQERGEVVDLIVCTGVLHHLSDPPSGLRALRAVLDLNGALDLWSMLPTAGRAYTCSRNTAAGWGLDTVALRSATWRALSYSYTYKSEKLSLRIFNMLYIKVPSPCAGRRSG